MRAYICTNSTRVNIKADLFKLQEEQLLVYNGQDLVGIFKLKEIIDAHLSEEKR